MKEIDIFLQIYRNKYLRDKIFNYIRDINQTLEYITYNYYDFPLQSIINNNSQSHFIERLNLYYKYIINNNDISDNNNNGDIDLKIYKYQINFNKDIFTSCIKWKGLTLECFKSLYKSFKCEMESYWNFSQTSINEFTNTLIVNGNYKVYKYIDEHTKLSTTINQTKGCPFDLKVSSTSKITKLINYLYIKGIGNVEDVNRQMQSVHRADCINFLHSIVNENKSDELGPLVFKLLELHSIPKVAESSPHEFSTLMNLSIEKSDSTMVKLLLSKFQWNKATGIKIASKDLIQLYGYTLKIVDFNLFLIRMSSLCSSSLIEVIQVILKTFPHVYGITGDVLNSFLNQTIEITDPKTAELLISLNKNFPHHSKVYFSHRCIKEDLSNIGLFTDRVKWIQSDVDILNYQKLQYFVDRKISLSDSKHKNSFNGDVKLFKLFNSCGTNKVSHNTTLCASKNGHTELLGYLLQDNIFNFIDEDFYSTAHNYQSLFLHSIVSDDQQLFKKLVNYKNWENLHHKISIGKPNDMEKRIAYFRTLSKIKLTTYNKSQYIRITNTSYKYFDLKNKQLLISLFEYLIGLGEPYIQNTCGKIEIANLIPLAITLGNFKLLNQLKKGYLIKHKYKFELLSWVSKLNCGNQMLLYLFSVGLIVPENVDQIHNMVSVELVNLALQNNNLSMITMILNLLSKGTPFIKSHFIIDYCNLTNEFHLQLFKNCVKQFAPSNSSSSSVSRAQSILNHLDSIHRNAPFGSSSLSEMNAHYILNHLISINYSYKPTKILLKPIEGFNSSTFKLNEKFEIYSKFLKNVGLYDFLFENNNNKNKIDSICLGVEKLKFTL